MLYGNIMAKEFARKFYNSKAWKKCEAGYLRNNSRLCEECLKKGIYKPAEIVHHKIFLTPDNINNPIITLNADYLEAVCRECHAAIHGKKKKRYEVADGAGSIAPR